MAYLKGPYQKQANRPPLTTTLVSSRKIDYATKRYVIDDDGNSEGMDDTSQRALVTTSFGSPTIPESISGVEFERRRAAVLAGLSDLEADGAIEVTSVSIEAGAAGFGAERVAYINRQPGQSSKRTVSVAEYAPTALVTDTFFADGTWTRPTSVHSAIVQAWGAGGGGTTGVGAGGGGAFASSTISTLTEATYAVTVGQGAADTDGEDSSFAALVVAKGGLSGTNGGTGGQSGDCTGDTAYSGGDGFAGATGTTSGGSAGSGGAASGFTAGVPDGGYGGSQSVAEYAPGGGGHSTASTQLAGLRGEVRVTYTKALPVGYAATVSRTSGRELVNSTSHAITIPSDVVVGDLLLLFWSCDGDNDGGSDHSINAGWTRLSIATSTGVTGAVYYKIATGTDSPTITTTDSESGVYEVLRIVNGGTPEATSATGSSTNADPPNHTPSAGSAAYLWIAAAMWDANVPPVITAGPSGYGSVCIQPGNSSTGTYLAVCEKNATASSENPGAFTSTTEQWVALTVSVPYSA